METSHIRNFVIISHVDHGKSTLADRLLEITGTVEARQMRPQYLDQLDLERERGITIKMAPVRMSYALEGSEYALNLIDTPGHSDFSYEVSRALRAVEGAILLVDATQGIQAQTLATLEAARRVGLTVVGAVNKVDLRPSGLDEVVRSLAELLDCPDGSIHRISGKTGEGVRGLLKDVILRVPPPRRGSQNQALIFDSHFDEHKGIIAYTRIFSGAFTPRAETRLCGASEEFQIKEVGFFSPKLVSCDVLHEGEIGYIATGIKNPGVLKIGDTIGDLPLAGYDAPRPVVFASLYPSDGDRYDDLKSALNRLRLMDSSLEISSDYNEVLGRGFRAGFLGKLHFEIATERLRREFGLDLITSFPSVAYKVHLSSGEVIAENPHDIPDSYLRLEEPVVDMVILAPARSMGKILNIAPVFRMSAIRTSTIADRVTISARMPIAELIADFDDTLKSVSEGFASFSYEFAGYEPADVAKLEVLVAEEPVPGLVRMVYRSDLERAARKITEQLKELLPRQLFPQAIQAKAFGRIIARETVPALKKDVTGHLYGGDRTRKMKLWKKQKEGKKRLGERGKGGITISPELFKELIRR